MIKKLFTEKKNVLLISITVFFIVLYIFISIFKPSDLLIRFFHYSINNPEKVNKLFYSQVFLLIVLSAVLYCFALFYKSSIYKKTVLLAVNSYEYILNLINLNFLIVITLLYLLLLFPLAVAHYDLGYDEAVYLEYAKNFAHTSVAYITLNEKIILIDTIAMLPHYLASIPNFLFGFTDLWSFKLTSSILSILTLAALLNISKKHYGKASAILFIFFLVIQPGFGFMATSYFGELIQAAFLLFGFSICFGDDKNLLSQKKLIVSSLFISLAIHTKFQLAVIVTFTMISLYFSFRQKGILRLLVYTILFSALLSFIRTIPVLIYDYSLLRRMILITDIFSGPAYAPYNIILEKFQLFNRFFPLPLFLIICAVFYFSTKSLFERALFYFSVITAAWWIFLYPLTTYRNPFMGIIPVCLMAAILIIKAYDYSINKFTESKYAVKLISAICLIFLLISGCSANLIYAYIGYNDGVQFDLDGFRNRLFSPPVQNTAQHDFYEGVKKRVNPADTVYNGTWVAQYYLPNPVCTFEVLKESLSRSPGEKYLLVTRDFYPLGFDKIYPQIDSLEVKKRLIFQTDQHELYGVSK